MHRSKLSTFVLDCRTDDLEAAATFWARALGRTLKPPQPGDTRYRDLECGASEPLLMIQRVEHESRVHLDIESDDIDAEVARLESLGAKRIEKVHTWTVMQAPTGQRFCVVRPQRGKLVLGANTWPRETTAPTHPLLARMPGRYAGETKTWLAANGAPDVSRGELYIDAIAGGRFLRLEEHGSLGGKARSGEALLGWSDRFELTWVDSFHTPSMIVSHGAAVDGPCIVVLGGGWRTELTVGDGHILQRMYSGETLRIQTEWLSK